MSTRVLAAGVRATVVLIALGVCGYYFGRGAVGVARQAFRDFVSG